MPPEPLDRRRRRAPAAPAVVDTSLASATAVAAGGDDLGDDRGGGSGVGAVAVHRAAEVVDDDAGAPLGEQARVGPAEAAPGAGDDRDPSVEAVLVHSCAPSVDSEGACAGPCTVRSDAVGRSERRAPTQREVEGAPRAPSSTPRRRCSREQGYHATGIVELCEVNGLGKGAFYHYIGSKEELLAAIHDRVMDEVMLGADRVAEAGGSPSAQLARLGDELLDVIHRYPDHVWVFLHEFPALTGERADQFRVRRRSTSGGSRRSCRPASTPASSATSIPGSPPSPGSACTTTPTCG